MIDNNSGFTLIEFLVAIVILMVGMLGMLQGVNLALNKSVETGFRNEALVLADEMMVQKRAKSFISISTTTANPPNMAPSPVRTIRGIPKTYTVQQIVVAPTDYSKEITINVGWDYKKNKYSHSISSIVSTFPK